MSLNLDLKNWSRVTAHHLPKVTLGVKFNPDLDKGRLIMLQQVKLNGQTECPLPQSMQSPNYGNLLVQFTFTKNISKRNSHGNAINQQINQRKTHYNMEIFY